MVPSQLHISLHKSTAARPFSFCGSAFYIRERWRLSFDPPARRAVFRRQRQRDSSLWTPFHRLRAGRGPDMLVYLCCFGPPKERRAEGGAAASLSACEYNNDAPEYISA